MTFSKLSPFNTVFSNLAILLDTSAFVHALNDTEYVHIYTVQLRVAPVLVSVSLSGQCHHFSMVLEWAKYAIQVPSTDSAVNICDLPSKNQSSSHLVVFREIPF